MATVLFEGVFDQSLLKTAKNKKTAKKDHNTANTG